MACEHELPSGQTAGRQLPHLALQREHRQAHGGDVRGGGGAGWRRCSSRRRSPAQPADDVSRRTRRRSRTAGGGSGRVREQLVPRLRKHDQPRPAAGAAQPRLRAVRDDPFPARLTDQDRGRDRSGSRAGASRRSSAAPHPASHRSRRPGPVPERRHSWRRMAKWSGQEVSRLPSKRRGQVEIALARRVGAAGTEPDRHPADGAGQRFRHRAQARCRTSARTSPPPRTLGPSVQVAQPDMPAHRVRQHQQRARQAQLVHPGHDRGEIGQIVLDLGHMATQGRPR